MAQQIAPPFPEPPEGDQESADGVHISPLLAVKLFFGNVTDVCGRVDSLLVTVSYGDLLTWSAQCGKPRASDLRLALEALQQGEAGQARVLGPASSWDGRGQHEEGTPDRESVRKE